MAPDTVNGVAAGDMTMAGDSQATGDARPEDAANPAGEDASTDAMTEIDAASGMGGAGETCASALSLVDESVLDMASIRYTLNGSYAAENNYNPYSGNTDGLPLAVVRLFTMRSDAMWFMRFDCHPAKHFEHGWRHLDEIRSTVGLYFIHDCETGTILDTDGSGACGNNEYSTQVIALSLVDVWKPTNGFTNILMKLWRANRRMRTLYLVVDEIANDLGADFSIEMECERIARATRALPINTCLNRISQYGYHHKAESLYGSHPSLYSPLHAPQSCGETR